MLRRASRLPICKVYGTETGSGVTACSACNVIVLAAAAPWAVEHRRYTECQMYMPTVRWRPCGAQNKSPRVSMFMPPGVAPRGPALSPLRAPCGGDHAAKAQGTPARLEDDSLSVAVAGTSGQGRATWWLQLFPNLLRCPAMSCTSLHAAVTSSGCKPATSTARKAPPHPDCHCSAATHLAGS